MAVQVIREVDSIYEGVLLSKLCGRCRGRRPHRGGRGYYGSGRRARVIFFQITADGQFHMRLPSGPSDEALCGVAAR